MFYLSMMTLKLCVTAPTKTYEGHTRGLVPPPGSHRSNLVHLWMKKNSRKKSIIIN